MKEILPDRKLAEILLDWCHYGGIGLKFFKEVLEQYYCPVASLEKIIQALESGISSGSEWNDAMIKIAYIQDHIKSRPPQEDMLYHIMQYNQGKLEPADFIAHIKQYPCWKYLSKTNYQPSDRTAAETLFLFSEEKYCNNYYKIMNIKLDEMEGLKIAENILNDYKYIRINAGQKDEVHFDVDVFKDSKQ